MYAVSPTFQARVDALLMSGFYNFGFPANTGSAAEALVHSPEILREMKNYCSSGFGAGSASSATCAVLQDDFRRLEDPKCP